MRKKHSIPFVCLLLTVAIAAAGVGMFLGKNFFAPKKVIGTSTKGIRTSTFGIPNKKNPKSMDLILAVDMIGKDVLKGYSTFAFYDQGYALDVYGKMNILDKHFATLKNHKGKYYGTLYIKDNLALLTTKGGKSYKMKLYLEGERFIISNYTNWYKEYGNKHK